MAPSERYHQLLLDAWELHKRKNAGYAGVDNPDPWANFRMAEAFGVTAVEGCLVRMSDKYIRVTNLMRDPNNDKVGESIKDTLYDLAAYALITICLMEEDEAEADAPKQWTFTERVGEPNLNDFPNGFVTTTFEPAPTLDPRVPE